MTFKEFFDLLAQQNPSPRVEIEHLRNLINLHHLGVGELKFVYFEGFEGASPGHFVWGEEDRTSPYDDPFNHAYVFLNRDHEDDRFLRRFVAAKELMHVFDSEAGKADTKEKYTTLVQELASNPVLSDASPPYLADREAMWKAILCLVPPWIRDEVIEAWAAGQIDASELEARWHLPAAVVSAAMQPYYDKMKDRFLK